MCPDSDSAGRYRTGGAGALPCDAPAAPRGGAGTALAVSKDRQLHYPMDHALSPALIERRRALQMAAVCLALAACAAAAWAVQRAVQPSIGAAELRVATVRRGDIANTISAAGVVIPVHEELVSSPIQTHVAHVHAKLGQEVKAGELLLTLDDAAVRLALDAVKEQLAQQDNRIVSLTLEMEQKRKQLASSIELLALDLQSAQARLQRFNTLRKSGAVSGEDLLTAELNVERAQIQLRQSREAIEDGKRATASNVDGARLQQAILRKQLEQQQVLLAHTSVRAPFAGMVSALMAEEGASVATGQLVAKVSEMNNYRVEATLSDFHARAIEAGQRVTVTQNGRRIDGQVQTILPEIQNGAIKLLLTLAAPHDAQLRNKMRVDVDIVTATTGNALLVDAGEAFNGRGAQAAFVVGNGEAQRRDIEIGASDGQSLQIVKGAREGERLIVSSVARFKDAQRIRITE
ncbi:efflux RND transporter periplasmic adaptor subunit [Massilia sp. DWR3-1-1]|uniref:efflux RND transporter periplasmic adaptor subunit n=1 Tax=Massilia sp. DWR3-1-1 TaxID=2804559 RepID=UPI003CF65588